MPADYQGIEAKFDNRGTFKKTGVYGSAVDVDFDNSGLVNIEAGYLTLTNDFINTGVVNVNAGSLSATSKTTNNNRINVEAGSLSLTGGGNNNGIIYVDIDATLTLGGVFNVGTGSQITGRGNVTLNSGQLNFDVNQTTISDDLIITFDGGKLNYQGNLAIEKYVLGASASQLLANENSTLSLGIGSWNNGSLALDSKTSFSGNLSIGYGNKYITGVLSNHGVVTHQDYGYSYYYGYYYGNLYLTNGSQIINQADATYDFQGGNIRQYSTDGGVTVGKFNNLGTLRKTNNFNAEISVDLYNSGSIETEAGNLYITKNFINAGTVNVRGGVANFTDDFEQTAGSIVLHNGQLNSTQALNIQGGQIGGYGAIAANINNSGLLNPYVAGNLGSETSTINLTGNYTETDNAQINIQIGGRDAGTQFDVVNITGVANFDGTINISLINGFNPIIGNSFKIINYGSYTGSSELDFNGLIIGGGLRFNPIFNSNDLTLFVAASAAPDANNDTYGVNQNQTLTINAAHGVLTNDTHPNNDTKTATLRTNANYGQVTLNSNGSFSYIPNPGFVGTDSFIYKNTDSDGDFDLATVTINVTTPPIGTTDQAPTVANHIAPVLVGNNAANTVIDLSNVFTDVDNDVSLITKSVLTNSNVTLFDSIVINGNTLTLDYKANQSGTAQITLQALSNDKTVTEAFTVIVDSTVISFSDQAPTVANHLPVLITNEDAPDSLVDLSNVFTDVDNDPSLITKTVLSNSNPTLFDLVGINGNNLTLDYKANQSGIAQIVIQALSNGKTVTESLIVMVNPIDDAPIVSNPIADVSINTGAPNQIINLANVFSDADNDNNLIIKSVLGNTNPTLVNASISGNNLTLDYHQNATGSADITILGISNGLLIQDTFTVTLKENPPVVKTPIADKTVNEGVAFSLAVGNNFSDIDGDILTYSTSSLPSWLSFNPITKTFSGTPINSSIGTIPITITATDDGGTSVSDTFNITVVDVPNGNFSLQNSVFSVGETDNTLAVTVVRGDSSLGAVSVTLTTANSLTLNSASTADYLGGDFVLNFANGEISKTFNLSITDDILPEEDETFNLSLSNPTGGAILGNLKNAIVTIVDNEPPIQNPIAVNDQRTAIALETITIDVLKNDYDPDNYRKPIEIYRVFVNGQEYNPYVTTFINTTLGGKISLFTNSTPNDKTDDKLYYTAPSATLSDSFTYTIKDGDLDSDLISSLATVTVNVQGETRTETNTITVKINNSNVSYTSSEIQPYGNQDLNGNFHLFDNNAIDLDGNTWKAIALKDYGYTEGYIISTDTILSFEFKSNTIGEFQGIALATENNLTSDINPNNVLNLYGSAVNYGIRDFTYTNIGLWQTFSVNLSNYANGKLNYLLFVSDDDANNKGDTQIRNLQLNQSSTNRKPTNILLNNNSIAENQPVGTAIATISTVDEDVNDIHNYILLDNASGAFTISGNQLIANKSFDFEYQSSYTIKLQTNDGRGGIYTKNFVISITDVIEYSKVIIGDNNNNNLVGTAGNDYIEGRGGNDILDGKGATDNLIGGLGNDTYYIDNGGDTITELSGEGTDTVFSTAINYTLSANLENLILTGTIAIKGTGNDANNSITGNAGNNELNGGAGSDILNGGAGADTLVGGIGNDTYYVDNIGDVIIETSTLATEIDVVSSSVSYTLSANVEKLTLTGTVAINGTGNESANTITGNAVSNTLIGGIGNDILNGGVGTDTLVGGVGNDSYYLDNTGDVVTELPGEGTDIVYSTTDYNLFGTNIENLTLQGTANLKGIGSESANTITGNTADNELDGGAGNDILSGGTGNDTLVGGIGKDILTGGVGIDAFNYQILSDSLLANYDWIKDFNANEDKLLVAKTTTVFTQAGTVTALTQAGITTKLTTTNFVNDQYVARFTFGTRSFLTINDTTAGFNQANDVIIEITGLTGTLGLGNFVTV